MKRSLHNIYQISDIIGGVRLPIRCPCGMENMLDLENLDIRPMSKLVSAEGFTCSACGEWKILFFNTPSLKALLERLNQMNPTHKNFQYYFAKTLRKAEGVRDSLYSGGRT